ncbi:MAG TPA: AMP-binding protein [Alphaproteobacteria bacterium]|nr:AMP-binding protein [Alphaproteobacteria bacterium]
MSLGQAFVESATQNTDALALSDGSVRLTYGGLQARAAAVAGGLVARGLQPGDRLLTLLTNRWETATLYWACQMSGVVFTPFNWRATAEEVAIILADSEAKLVVCEHITESAGPADSINIDDDFLELSANEPLAAPVEVAAEDPCLMLYTSGTTGGPKGVPRSHAAELAAGRNAITQLGYQRGEIQLGVMPLFHTMGVRQLLTCELLGGHWVAMAQFDAGAALAHIAEERISALFLVPTVFHDIVNHPDIANADLSSVRTIGYAGMSMRSALTARCAEVFQPQRFHNFYGSSEIFTFTVCDHVADKPGCAGMPGIGQEIRIVRADAAPTVHPDDTVPRGGLGEIIASMASPEAFCGYWRRPDADTKAIRDGWYFTGDLGYFDEDGELYVIGRVDDMIISGGENIHPEEVEDVLTCSPLVRQAAVIGVADKRWGERVTAFVEPAQTDASAVALDSYCLDNGLARFKRPRDYVFVAKIPRSGSGKLLRRELRDGNYRVLLAHDTRL